MSCPQDPSAPFQAKHSIARDPSSKHPLSYSDALTGGSSSVLSKKARMDKAFQMAVAFEKA